MRKAFSGKILSIQRSSEEDMFYVQFEDGEKHMCPKSSLRPVQDAAAKKHKKGGWYTWEETDLGASS